MTVKQVKPRTRETMKKMALILAALRKHAQTDRIAPTNPELSRVCGAESDTGSVYPLELLEADGVIKVRRFSNARIIEIDGVELRSATGSFNNERVYQRGLKRAPRPKPATTAPSEPRPEYRLYRHAPLLPPPESFTARVCGDPLPGRSALDRKRAAEQRLN